MQIRELRDGGRTYTTCWNRSCRGAGRCQQPTHQEINELDDDSHIGIQLLVRNVYCGDDEGTVKQGVNIKTARF